MIIAKAVEVTHNGDKVAVSRLKMLIGLTSGWLITELVVALLTCLCRLEPLALCRWLIIDLVLP
jgi:hypothetical protein